MCIIVDINTFSHVFVPGSDEYSHFSPIGKHIRSNKSKLIVGGAKFLSELKFLAILSELKKADQLVVANSEEVDSMQKLIEEKIMDPAFNDQHIVALASVSRARLVVTKDNNLQKHLRARAFYNRGFDRPNIYNQQSPSSLIPNREFPKKCLLCK